MTLQFLPRFKRPERPVSVRPSLHREWLDKDFIHALLAREVSRADRSGTELSLVLFRVNARNVETRATARLKRTLEARARNTDELGWFDSRNLCAILPTTSTEGAVQFVNDIRSLMARFSLKPICTIYTYPSHWLDSVTVDGNDDDYDRDRFGGSGGSMRLQDAAPLQVQPIKKFLLNPMPWWKRLMDIVLSASALLLAFPLMLAVAAAIKLDSHGPVFFTQRRAGFGGEPFKIYKFRTMVPNADSQKKNLRKHSEQDGPAFKMTDDPRQTKFGRWLRKTSLDELPQLWNVLIGDMSLVGPRPLPIDESDGCDSWQTHRLCVRPGLTCIWQVEGRSRVAFADWARMDVQYIRNRSFLNDLNILFRTVPAVLKRRGAC